MKQKNDQQRKKKLLIGLLIVIVSVIGCVTFFLMKEEPTAALEYEKNAVEYETKINQPEALNKNTITFPGYGNMTIEEGTEILYIALVNPSFNKGNIKFNVSLDQETAPLLKTNLVTPGKAVTEVPLPKKIAVGKHTIKIEMLGYADDEGQTRLSGTSTSFELTVLKKGSAMND